MNPVIHWVVAQTIARRRLRRCPHCGHSQIVGAARERETVPCDRCRTSIPPAPPARAHLPRR